MSIEDGTTRYNLKRPITYYDKDFGGETQAEFIELREPEFVHRKQAFAIQQMVNKLLMEMQKNQDVQDSIEGESVKPIHEVAKEIEDESESFAKGLEMFLMISEKINVGDFVESFCEMATIQNAKRHLAMLDGKYSLKQTHLEQMSPNELIAVATRWAAFFAMPAEMQNNISANQ